MKQRLQDRIRRKKIYERLAAESDGPFATQPNRKAKLAYAVLSVLIVPPLLLWSIYAFGN